MTPFFAASRHFLVPVWLATRMVTFFVTDLATDPPAARISSSMVARGRERVPVMQQTCPEISCAASWWWCGGIDQ